MGLVATIFADILAMLAATLVLAGVIGAAMGETLADDLLGIAAIGLFLSVATRLTVRPSTRRFTRAESFALVAAVWFGLPILIAPTIQIAAGVGIVDAIFEATSALTTTGASVFRTLSDKPATLIVWQCFIAWFGGALTLVSFIYLLAPAGLGGLPDRHARELEHGGASEQQRLVETLGEVLPIYGGLTLIVLLALLASGIPPFDALCLALSGVSTAGIMPRDGTMAVYANPAAEVILAVAMMLGATSILWQRFLIGGRIRLLIEHRESYAVIAVIVGLAVVYGLLVIQANPGRGSTELLRDGFFMAASIVSTSGFEIEPGAFSVFPVALVAFVSFLGGATFSTAGGIKFYRFGAMILQTVRELMRLLYPHAVRPARIGVQPYDMQLMKAIWTAFSVGIAAFLLCMLIAATAVPDFEGAYVAGLAVFTNAGPLYPGAWSHSGTWPHWSEMPDATKLLLAVAMVVGRVEVIALLALVHLAFWRR